MMSWSKMLQSLLLAAICSALCAAEIPAMLPAIFKPVVMYTSPNSAVIKWEELRRKQEKDGYTIEYGKNWQNSKMVQVSKSSNTAIISDLEPDTLYNIRVLVPGTILPGPSVSFRTKPVASARIGVPQNITLVPLPFYKLLVSWDLPYRARASDVVHYSLVFAPVYSPYLRKTSLLLPGHYKSFTLTYLRPNTLYKVKIAALLKKRKGPFSAWVIAQTVGQVRLENPTQPITKIPLSKTTALKLHNQKEIPGTIMTTLSTRSTVETSQGLQLTTKQAMTEQNVQTTSYQTKEESSVRPITETMQGGKSMTRQTTEASVGHITDLTKHSTLKTTHATEKMTTMGQDTKGTTLPVTLKPTERERIKSTTQATEKMTSQGTEGTTLPVTLKPTERERIKSTTQATEKMTSQGTEGTTLPVTLKPTERERIKSTTHATEKTTTSQGTEGTTLPVTTVPPSEQERDDTTQQTSQVTTEGKQIPATQQITPSLLRTTTPSDTIDTSPSRQTEQVTETTPQTRFTTGGTRKLTTRQVKLKTTTTPSSTKTTEHKQAVVTTTTATPPPRKTTQPATTTLQTTEEAKSTEQTVDSVTKQVTATQPTIQTTEQAGRASQETTHPNQQTTKKPTAGHLQTNTVISGTVDLIPPTTDVVTDQRVADAQLFTSSPSPKQPSIIITPSSSTVPSLMITGILPTTPPQDTCEVLKPSMCSDIGYQTTKMTSKAKRQSQMMHLVQSMWSQLTPLCQSHAKLKQFLCAASFPYCSKNLGGPFLPCRSMCMATKKRCNMNSEDWPAELDCSKFPDVGESAICISYGHESTASTTTIQGTLSTPVKPTNGAVSESQTMFTLATKSGLATSNPTIAATKTPPKHCEPLYLKACEGVGYKHVQFPNFFNHSHQNDAGVKISKYWPLIEVKCSPLFQLFLCSLYTPICTSTATRNVLPCRSLCRQVTSDCSYLMELYGFAWPEGIRCQDFPDALDGTCLSQKYLTNLQGNEIAVPTFPTISDKAQVTSQYKRPSTEAPLRASQTVSVNPELTTARSSPYSKKSDKPTLATRPKTEKNMNKEYVDESTEAIVQRNEGEFASSVKPTTGTSANEETGHLTSTKSILISSPTSLATTSPPPGCEGLYLKMCQGVGYHFIQLPNFFNHTHQNDAGRDMYGFWPLVETNCSPKLQLFLCSLYAPMCTKTVSSARRITGSLTNNVLPCRSLCHQVKLECGTLMKLYGLKWPQGVECKGFPTDGEETCMGTTNNMASNGLLKVTKAKAAPSPSSGTINCQPLPPGHPCKNHYEMASLPNASATFVNTMKFIQDQTSKIKDMASKKCLRNLEMFLCSVHTPRCFGNGTVFGPCRSQCKTTLRRCAALLVKINIHVIDLKDCRQFSLTQCTGNKQRSKPKTKSEESL